MINFHSVTLRNFMSFGNSESTFKLDGSGVTLITGENQDDTSDGQSANGVGKTCLLNAITFALYAKPVTDVSTLDKLINNINKRNMFVSIIFEKNNRFFKVLRARKLKGHGGNGTFVEIYENDNPHEFNEEHLITTANDANNQIEKILGINYELFVRIVLFTADRNSFFDLPERSTSKGKASQTSIIETLFGLTEISEKAEILKQQIKDNNNDLKSLTLIHQQCVQEIERHENQIENAKNRVDNWKKEHKRKIKQIEEEIEILSNVDITSQKALLSEYEMLTKKIVDIKNEQFYNSTTRQNQITKKLVKIDNDLEHLQDSKCPYCLQDYQETKNKIKELENEQSSLIDELETITAYLDDCNAKIKELDKNSKILKKDLLATSLSELIEIEKEQTQIASKLSHLKKESNPHIEALQELKEMVLPEPQTDKIEELKSLIDHQQFLHKLLTKRDSFIRTVLLDKNIPFLNNQLTSYVKFLGLPHKILFTHQLTIEITKFGEPLDFGNLSTGQRARVNLALSLAFRDVLQKLHTPINLCIFDEVLDLGLDSVGVQLAVKLLKRKARSEKIRLYIISHREEITGSFDSNLKIIFSEGFSHIGKIT